MKGGNPTKTMENEPITIKLSQEQIEQREIQLIRNQMNLEMVELNIVHMERAMEAGLPTREAKLQTDILRKNLEQFRHNAIALREQIDKGEM